jgi:hypothetical protein
MSENDNDICFECGTELGFGPCQCGIGSPALKKFPDPSKTKFRGSMRMLIERKLAMDKAKQVAGGSK